MLENSNKSVKRPFTDNGGVRVSVGHLSTTASRVELAPPVKGVLGGIAYNWIIRENERSFTDP
ncbi:MAG: hypothetical protein LBF75_11745 [Treponema sp.]|jgi:hypothetical protein|nr:hypothetical protein [Treponema sp.]